MWRSSVSRSVRSVGSVTDAVEPVESPAAEEQVNACDSLTGFTGMAGSTAALDTSVKVEGTGSIKLTGQTRTFIENWDGLTAPVETGTVELSGLSLTTPATRPYISFDGYVKDCSDFSATLLVDGEEATFVSATRVNASWVTFMFHTDVTDTITTLRMAERITGTYFGVPGSWAPRIDNIRRSGAAESYTRQSLRAVPVRGSARTQGSVAISHPTDGLGKTLLLTSPALATGFTPDLMKWCVDSPSVDGDSMSGKVKTFASGAVDFEFPAALVPSGSYQLFAYMETGTADEDNALAMLIEASTVVGGEVLDTSEERHRITPTGDGVFDFVDCGPVTLPPTDVPAGSTATVALTLAPLLEIPDKDVVVTSASFHEFFLIPVTADTAWTLVDCGTGTAEVGVANNRLWIDSATLSTGNPSIWMGTEEDRTDAYHAAIPRNYGRWMPLSLTPPGVLLFMANSGGEGATASLTHTPSWLGLAAE